MLVFMLIFLKGIHVMLFEILLTLHSSNMSMQMLKTHQVIQNKELLLANNVQNVALSHFC